MCLCVSVCVCLSVCLCVERERDEHSVYFAFGSVARTSNMSDSFTWFWDTLNRCVWGGGDGGWVGGGWGVLAKNNVP